MSWRYQPVVTVSKVGDVEDVAVSLAEVYFNDDGTLWGWTASTSIAPVGDDPDDLRADIAQMLVDAYCWAPVMLDDLKVGMTFKGVPIETRKALAKLVAEIGERISQSLEPEATGA